MMGNGLIAIQYVHDLRLLRQFASHLTRHFATHTYIDIFYTDPQYQSGYKYIVHGNTLFLFIQLDIYKKIICIDN